MKRYVGILIVLLMLVAVFAVLKTRNQWIDRHMGDSRSEFLQSQQPHVPNPKGRIRVNRTIELPAQ